MYDKGRGVPKNDTEAVKWCRKAAEQGFSLVQHSLASIYYKCESVPKNNVKAYVWWSLAKAIGVLWDNTAERKLDAVSVIKTFGPIEPVS